MKIQDAIKENTVIHCATEEEAKRILGLVKKIGLKWFGEIETKDDTKWNRHKEETCYHLYCNGVISYNIRSLHTSTAIIPSTEIESEVSIKPNAFSTQVGGDHYKDFAIQPFEFIQKNKLSFAQGNILKYVCRYKNKNGLQDLLKAKHYIDLLIESEYELQTKISAEN